MSDLEHFLGITVASLQHCGNLAVEIDWLKRIEGYCFYHLLFVGFDK